jgi:hypothetical protein
MTGTLDQTTDASAVRAGVSTSGGPRPASDVTPDASCAQEKKAKSTYSTAMVSFTLTNNTISDVTMFYIDDKGRRQKQSVVQSYGGNVTQRSTKTQPWVIADGTGRCLLFFNGAAKTLTIE